MSVAVTTYITALASILRDFDRDKLMMYKLRVHTWCCFKSSLSYEEKTRAAIWIAGQVAPPPFTSCIWLTDLPNAHLLGPFWKITLDSFSIENISKTRKSLCVRDFKNRLSRFFGRDWWVIHDIFFLKCTKQFNLEFPFFNLKNDTWCHEKTKF